MNNTSWLKEMFSNSRSASSFRVINFIGCLCASEKILLSPLEPITFGAYLAYCAGTYGVGKYLDKKGHTP